MAGNFIAMVYAVLRDKGVDTKGMSTDEAVAKYNELTGKTGRYSVPTGQKFSNEKKYTLSSQEYAVVRDARAKKFAIYRRNGVPQKDYVFTSSKFVTFTNMDRDNFIVRSVVDIEDNRALIACIIKEMGNGKDN